MHLLSADKQVPLADGASRLRLGSESNGEVADLQPAGSSALSDELFCGETSPPGVTSLLEFAAVND
jgi:hypothetical protein